ncbi:MAG: AIM24 family protein [Actinomycetota bacterium]|nr:AIM24 family protein [Actinomycetota bacterium]
MSLTDERVACRWCRAQTPGPATTCERCGAPLDIRDSVTDSGWRAAPRLRDLTELSIGSTRIQVDGTIVPVVDVDLGAGEAIFFEHHAMLWKDATTSMSVMDAPGGTRRMLGSLPFVLSVATGPGRVSCSRDAPGEVVVLPVEPGQELDVREHAMLLATSTLSYSFEKLAGFKATLAVGSGMYLERFRASGSPGLLILHGFGNVMDRTLADGESIEIEPGGFLYKEASVGYELSSYKLTPEGSSGAAQMAKGLASRGLAGLKAARALKKEGLSGILSGDVMQQASAIFTGPGLTLMKMTGPGRVGIQSMYQHFGAE